MNFNTLKVFFGKEKQQNEEIILNKFIKIVSLVDKINIKTSKNTLIVRNSKIDDLLDKKTKNLRLLCLIKVLNFSNKFEYKILKNNFTVLIIKKERLFKLPTKNTYIGLFTNVVSDEIIKELKDFSNLCKNIYSSEYNFLESDYTFVFLKTNKLKEIKKIYAIVNLLDKNPISNFIYQSKIIDDDLIEDIIDDSDIDLE